MHLTLRFLGKVQLENVAELERRLREQVTGFGELDLVCERPGCFPNPRRPRVVGTWVHDAGERLAALHRCVEEAVGCFAEKPAEQNFIGHVTLARPKQITLVEGNRLVHFIERAVGRRFGEWRCREIELIQSELSADGSRYTTLAKVGL